MTSYIVLSPRKIAHPIIKPKGSPRAKTPSPTKLATHYSVQVSKFELPREGSGSSGLGGALEDVFTDPSEAVTKASVGKSKSVHFDFCLLTSDGPRNPTPNELKLIAHAFPGCIGMSFKDLFIVMRFQTLSDAPPRPWPSHVAGLLLRITTKAPNEDEYRPKGEMGRGATIQVNPPIQRWIRPSTESINNLTKHLSTHYGCRVSQLAFYGARLEIWLTGKDLDLTTLPFRAGIIVVWYHLGSTDSQGHEAALRNQIPRNAKPDDAPYGKMLRPGVMLSNGGPQGAELLTTSGAPVRAVSGERFVTVSAHGFPGGAPAIWHPTKQSGQEIGTMVRVLGKTDIGLMRLEPDFRYEADVFDDPEYGGPTLTSFKSISDVKFADPLFLDSPFSGRCDGSAGHFAWRALPEGYENAKEGYWLETLWAYFGDGIPDMLDGTCGSAIFDQNNQVVSFFHLAGENGQAESIAAQHAIDDGLVLEAIAGSNS